MQTIQTIVEKIRASNAALRQAKTAMLAAEDAWHKASDAFDAGSRANRELHEESAKQLMLAWLDGQLAGKTLAQQQSFVDELAGLLQVKYRPHDGSLAGGEEVDRMERLEELASEVFGESIADFCFSLTDEERLSPEEQRKQAYITLDEQRKRAYGYMQRHMLTILCMRCVKVSGVWRADPKARETFKQKHDRIASWHVALRRAPNHYVLHDVFAALQPPGRVKQNGKEFAEMSGCHWAFRNPATIEADIANAVANAPAYKLADAA